MPTSKKGLLDQYPQTVTVRVTEAVVTNGMIVRIPTSYNLRDRLAMELLSYTATPYGADAWLTYLPTGANFAMYGLSHLYRGGAIPDIEEPTGLIDARLVYYNELTAAGYNYDYDVVREHPFKYPVIAHPASLWAFCQQLNGATPLDLVMRISYRLIEITDTQWQELFESILVRDTI